MKPYREKVAFLRGYHKFSFDLRKRLTPQKKTAITRTYTKYRHLISKVKSGEYTFIPYSKRNKITRNSYLAKILTASNTGVFVFKPGAEIRTIAGKHYITSKFMRRRDIFIPIPRRVYKRPELLPKWMEEIYKEFHPIVLSISVKGHRGGGSFGLEDMYKYLGEAFVFFSGGKKGSKNAINGVYATPLTKREENEVYGTLRKRGTTKKKKKKKNCGYRR